MGNKPRKIVSPVDRGRRDIKKVLSRAQMKYIQWALTNPAKSHMTQAKIAERFKISPPTINKIINGDYGTSPTMDLERRLNKQLERYLDTLKDCFYFKNNQTSRRGLPDYIICLRGWYVAIECKKENLKGKLNRGRYLQQHWNLQKIHSAGGLGMTCTPDNLYKVKKFLKEIAEDITNDKAIISADAKRTLIKRASKTIGSLEIFPKDELQRGEDSSEGEELREPVCSGVEQSTEEVCEEGREGEHSV